MAEVTRAHEINHLLCDSVQIASTFYLRILMSNRRFIKWTQDTFVAGGARAELIPLLERCTSAFQQDERYRNDLRYLRIWILYVRRSGMRLSELRSTTTSISDVLQVPS